MLTSLSQNPRNAHDDYATLLLKLQVFGADSAKAGPVKKRGAPLRMGVSAPLVFVSGSVTP